MAELMMSYIDIHAEMYLRRLYLNSVMFICNKS